MDELSLVNVCEFCMECENNYTFFAEYPFFLLTVCNKFDVYIESLVTARKNAFFNKNQKPNCMKIFFMVKTVTTISSNLSV